MALISGSHDNLLPSSLRWPPGAVLLVWQTSPRWTHSSPGYQHNLFEMCIIIWLELFMPVHCLQDEHQIPRRQGHIKHCSSFLTLTSHHFCSQSFAPTKCAACKNWTRSLHYKGFSSALRTECFEDSSSTACALGDSSLVRLGTLKNSISSAAHRIFWSKTVAYMPLSIPGHCDSLKPCYLPGISLPFGLSDHLVSTAFLSSWRNAADLIWYYPTCYLGNLTLSDILSFSF